MNTPNTALMALAQNWCERADVLSECKIEKLTGKADGYRDCAQELKAALAAPPQAVVSDAMVDNSPEWVAEVFPDWTTLQIIASGDAFAFNRATGKPYKLPHKDCPFIDITAALNGECDGIDPTAVRILPAGEAMGGGAW